TRSRHHRRGEDLAGCRWLAGRRRSRVIRTNCGPPLLATHARRHGPPAGHPSLARLAPRTVCKILTEQDGKSQTARYDLEKRDAEFEPKMAELLCVDRRVAMLRAQATEGDSQSPESSDAGSLGIISYDEKPGIQAIGTTAADRPSLPDTSPTVMRDL